METIEYPSWCRGVLTKYPTDALAVLHNLLDAAMAKGWCSSNDITHESPHAKQLHGCVFKPLRSCGLYQSDERIDPPKTDRKKHGHKAHKWRVRDGCWGLLEQRHAEIHGLAAKMLLREKPREGNQWLLLAM